MKKSILGLAALALLASCNNDEDIQLADKAVIGFNGVFVENSTRANDLTSSNIADFGVYGSLTKGGNSGLIFEDTRVYKNGDSFQYGDGDRYWVTSANYDFVAIAPYEGKQWEYNVVNNVADNGTITFNNQRAGANQDLLFASAERSTADGISGDKVKFTFNHMLSRVWFTFQNEFNAGSKITLKVTDVTIADAHSMGTLVVKNGAVGATWTVTPNSDANFTKVFGDAGTEALTENGGTAATEHFYLIPTKGTYDVTFNVELRQAGVSLQTYKHKTKVTLDMAKGCSYNIIAKLNQNNVTGDPNEDLQKIEFDVETVKAWTNAPDPQLP